MIDYSSKSFFMVLGNVLLMFLFLISLSKVREIKILKTCHVQNDKVFILKDFRSENTERNILFVKSKLEIFDFIQLKEYCNGKMTFFLTDENISSSNSLEAGLKLLYL